MKKKRLTRRIIIQTLVDMLEPLDYVHAFYEGGAAAFNRIDEWSDIDIYLVVDDERVNETYLTVEKALESLSPIEYKYKVLQSSWPGLSQTFYKLQDTSEFLVIDLAILTLSSPEKFLEPEVHGNIVFYFNKSGKMKPLPLNEASRMKKLLKRLERLEARFKMFNSFVQKEINRGNHLEALDIYRVLTLSVLIEVLRIKYNPTHYDFKMRYIHYELPSEVIGKLMRLHFVEDENDLEAKYHEATKWFHEVMSKIDQKEIVRSKGMSKYE